MLDGLKDGAKRGCSKLVSPFPSAEKYRCQSEGTAEGSRRYSSYRLSTNAKLPGPGTGSVFDSSFSMIRTVPSLAGFGLLRFYLQSGNDFMNAVGVHRQQHCFANIFH